MAEVLSEPLTPELVLVCPELRQLAVRALVEADRRSAALPMAERESAPPEEPGRGTGTNGLTRDSRLLLRRMVALLAAALTTAGRQMLSLAVQVGAVAIVVITILFLSQVIHQ
jgi:hypothetical protein